MQTSDVGQRLNVGRWHARAGRTAVRLLALAVLATTSMAVPSLHFGLTSMAVATAKPLRHSVRFDNPDEALRAGITAYEKGLLGQAIPALSYAAEHNLFFGQFYLARIFSNNDWGFTDHVRAFFLYQELTRDFADVQEDDPKVLFVSEALVQLAGYYRRGLPERGLKANRKRAASLLNFAATFFNDENAQFELAKLMLSEAKSRQDANTRRGLDWLSAIAQRGHAGAQAFLADLLWRGKFAERNPVRALALISVAAKNAPARDAFWIDDIHQNIYCGASEGVRRQATGMVADWDSRYGRRPIERPDRLPGLSVDAVRTCANGEIVPRLKSALDQDRGGEWLSDPPSKAGRSEGMPISKSNRRSGPYMRGQTMR